MIVIASLAAIRVWFFSAAFPFFNNVDEQPHFDTVVKYARGYLPRRGANYYSPEAAELIVLYGTPEYFKKPSAFVHGQMPAPVWTRAHTEMRDHIHSSVAEWTAMANYESFSPPLYYIVAGLWYRIGRAMGFTGGHELYWIRFLNIPLYFALVLASFFICTRVYPESRWLHLGVPLILVCFPQDAFYSINSDVVSPLVCLLSLYLLHRIVTGEQRARDWLMLGLLLSAAVLTKRTNPPILLAGLIILSTHWWRNRRSARQRGSIVDWALLGTGIGAPLALWLGWNSYALGDPTGSAENIRYLTWTVKPLSEMGNHPIFTLQGVATFLSHFTRTFWRGEFVWGLEVIASTAMDRFYLFSSLLCLLAGIIGPWIFRESVSPMHRRLNLWCGFILLSFVLGLVAFSLPFDFGQCWYPSREHPYFSSGRMALGALIPFLVLYVDGLALITTRISRRISPLAVVGVMSLVVLWSELRLSTQAIASAYNWFHL